VIPSASRGDPILSEIRIEEGFIGAAAVAVTSTIVTPAIGVPAVERDYPFTVR
jgi:hypothetical protein